MDQRKVVTIQCRATKKNWSPVYITMTSYWTRLIELRLPSLNYCHQRGDMIILYQIFNSLVDISANDFLHSQQGLPEDINENL